VARPPSIGYQMKLLARRHKPLIASAAAVLLVLVAGVVVSTSLFLQASRARDQAERERSNAMAALTYLREMVWSADPSKFGNEVKVGDLLDRYGASIEAAFPDQPEIQATMHSTVGRTYIGLELFESKSKAEHYKQAARRHLKAALRLREQVLGEDHPDTLQSMEDLAEMYRFHGNGMEAEQVLRRAVQVREETLGEGDPETLRTCVLLAKQLQRDGQVSEATEITRGAVERQVEVLGSEHPDTLEAQSELARLLWEEGERDESEQLRAQVLETALRVFGEGEPITEQARGDLAYAFVAAERFEDAARLYHHKMPPDELPVQGWHQGQLDPDHDPTVLVFWDSWCPPSQLEIPRLQQDYERWQQEGLQMVGVTARSDKQHVREFLDAKNVTFPMAADSPDRDSWNYFNVLATPTATAIKDGRVVWQGRAEQLNDTVFQSLLSDGK
jgi:thiol-disulfide isomerase/thioredoxin